LSAIDPFPGQRAGELRVELGQGAFDAAEGIGLDDRRVVGGGRLLRRGEQRDGRLAGLRPRAPEAAEPAVRIASSRESSQIESNFAFERVTGSTAPAASASGSWQVSGYSIFWIAPT
jgi:hypothetical protein